MQETVARNSRLPDLAVICCHMETTIIWTLSLVADRQDCDSVALAVIRFFPNVNGKQREWELLSFQRNIRIAAPRYE